MLGDFSQTTPIKDCWVFSSPRMLDIINALTPNFWKTNVKCYELVLVINKFCTCTQTSEDIQSINSNCCQQIPTF